MGRDAPLLILAEHPEGVLEVGLCVHVHDLLLDHQAEVLEVQGGGTVVDLVHHVLHLGESQTYASKPQHQQNTQKNV